MQRNRKLYLRIYLSMLLGMAAALGLVRLFAWANDASGAIFLDRVLEAREALPRIVEQEGDLVMVFGSSMTQAGFSARHFDRLIAERGGETRSWNFGFGGLNPFFQDYLSRRVREAFEAEDRKLALALIELNPFQTTTTRWQGAEPVIDSFITYLASDEELLEMALEDPERGALLYTIRYLRDGVSAEMITTFFGQELFEQRPQESDRPSLSEEDQARFDELAELLNERFEEEYPDFEDRAWSYEWQGAGTVPWERPAETVELFPEFYRLIQANERQMHDDLLFRIRTTDILELELEELLVERFIAVVESFKPIAERVEVILLPRNTQWVEYTPEARARLDALIERIERETGVPVRNHQEIPEITPAMFSDTTHLARYVGDIPYTEYLVEQYASYLIGE